MTQNERIIRHLSEYGIMRLASRISDLRTRGGYDIRREMVDGRNRYGEPTKYARYTLGG